MMPSAIAVVVVLSSVLGAVVGGAGGAWPGDTPGDVGERAVGLPPPIPLAPSGQGVGAGVGSGGSTVDVVRGGAVGAGSAALSTPITTLDFERLPDGTRLEDGARLVDEYGKVGIVFVPRETFAGPTGAIAGRCSADPRRAGSVVCSAGHSGDTVVYTPLVDEFNRHPLGVEFDEPQRSVSLFVQQYGFHDLPEDWPDSVGELVAYDARGLVVTRDRVVFGPSDGWQELEVDGGRQGIASVVVRFDRGGATENWFVVDDLQANTEADVPPEAVLRYEPLEPHPGEWIDFDSRGSSDPDGRIVSYDWTFARSDGTVLERVEDSDDTVPYRFDEPGEYRVSLTVFDDDGATDTETVTVVVGENEPPVARLDVVPSQPRPGERVVLDAGDSTDVDGTVVRYDWRVRGTGDDPFLFAFSSRTSTTYEPPLGNVTAPGEFEVRLTVTDDDGATDTETTTVVVEANDPPVADFGFVPGTPVTGEAVRFDGTVSTDDRGVVSYLWDLDGDREYEADTSRVTHAFPRDGSYPVTLLVVDGEGATDEVTRTVVVSSGNEPPVADFDVSPTRPAAGASVEFDGTPSFDPDGTVVGYEWTVDGAFVDDTPRLTHEFPVAGQYAVTLTVTDDREAVGRWTERVVVEDVVPPTPRIEFSPAVPLVGDLVTFDATTSTDDGRIVAYEWDLDGDREFERTGPVVERRYTTGGTYLVELVVVDDDTEANATSVAVRVNEPPVPAFRVVPSRPLVGEPATFDATASTDDGRIVAYEWDFDGDGRADATGRIVRRPLGTAGDLTVGLSVRDDDGVRNSTTRVVTVLERSTPTTTTPAVTPTEAPASPTATPGPDGESPLERLERTLREALPPVSPSRAAATGAAAVTVLVLVWFRKTVIGLLRDLRLPRVGRTTPRRGGRTRSSRDAPDPDETEEEDEEENRPPTASIRYVPEEPTVGRPVMFDGLGSVDPDGRVVGYRWSGDGPERSGGVVVHTFEEDGEHEVTLTVEDDDGATGEATATVEIEPAEGEIDLLAVHPDSPGRDHESLHLEYLVFGNAGEGPLEVEGWTVHDAAEEEDRVREGEHTYTFEGDLELAPGATVALYTGAEPEDAPPADTEDAHHRYWERTWPVWNNEGDVVVVKDEGSNPVLAARYERVGEGYRIEPIDHERLELLFPDAPARADGGRDGELADRGDRPDDGKGSGG